MSAMTAGPARRYWPSGRPVATLVDGLKGAGQERIPGERRVASKSEAMKGGIPVGEVAWRELREPADRSARSPQQSRWLFSPEALPAVDAEPSARTAERTGGPDVADDAGYCRTVEVNDRQATNRILVAAS